MQRRLATTAGPALALTRTTIGKKVLMSLSGMVGVGFVTLHMIGNAQVLLPGGRERLNHYAAQLRGLGALLWIARFTLLVAVIVHVVTALQLTRRKRQARPVAYARSGNVQAGPGARSMIASGVFLLAFITYHLLHMTFGAVHADFIEGDVGHNLVVAFQSWPVAASYIIAMLALALHLSHGAWSMFQTVGVSHPRANRLLRQGARALTFVVVAGNITIPVAVLAGLVT